MGCWNGTCGISQVPLAFSVDINFIIIQNQTKLPEASGFCYLNGYATPISFIMSGKYNDYGSVTDIEESLSVNLFLDYFKYNLKTNKIKVTPDNYYDKEDFQDNEIDYSKYTIEQLLSAIERDRIFIKSNDTFVNIGIQLFHTDILKSIFSEMFKENSFHKEIAEDIYLLKKETLPYWWSCIEFKILSMFNNFSYFNSKATSFYLKNLMENNLITDSHKMFSETIKLIYSMIELRQSWGASSGKGSQSFGESAYIGLVKGLNGFLSDAYFPDIGEEFYCYESIKDIKEDESFIINSINTSDFTVHLITYDPFNEVEKKEISLSLSDFKSHFEN